MKKRKTNMKRMLTGLLTVAMIMTALPAYVFAEELPTENVQAQEILAETEETGSVDEAGTVEEEPSQEPEAPAEEELTEEIIQDEPEPAEEPEELMEEPEELMEEPEEAAEPEEEKTGGSVGGVFVLVDDEDLESSDNITDWTISGLEEGLMTGSEIVFSFKPADGRRLRSVEKQFDDELFDDNGLSEEYNEETGVYTYTLSEETVREALEISANITFLIKTIRASELPVLSVAYDPDAMPEPVVKAGGVYLRPSPDLCEDGLSVYEIADKKTITIIGNPYVDYQLTKVILDGTEVPAALRSGMLTLVVEQDTDIVFEAKGLVTMFFSDDESTRRIKSNDKFSLRSEENGYVTVYEGNRPLSFRDDFTAKINGVDVPGFVDYAEFEFDDPEPEPGPDPDPDDPYGATNLGDPDEAEKDIYKLKINAAAAADKGGKTVIVTFTTEDAVQYKLNFTVAQLITAVKAKGFKFDSENDVYTIDQIRGTEMAYPLTLEPKGADPHILEAAIQISDPAVDAYVAVDEKGKAFLNVFTWDYIDADNDDYTVICPKESFTISFSRDDEQIGKAFVVTPVAPKSIAAPTVKVASASSADMTLSLAVPKAVQNYVNLYYKIEAKADDAETAETLGMKKELTEYAEAWEEGRTDRGSYKLKLSASDNPGPLDGHAVSYTITTTLVQVIDDSLEAGEGEGQKFHTDNISKMGSPKKLTKQKTKEPCYEAKLSLTKKTSAVTIGQDLDEPVLLAVPKFSAKTSVASIGSVRLCFGNGIGGGEVAEEDYGLEIRPDGIYLTDWSKFDILYPGQYTLVVGPNVPEGVAVQYATLPLTLKPGVTGVNLTAPSDKLYKVENRAASVKLTAVLASEYESPYKYDPNTDTYGTESFKPASSSLDWEVEAENDELLNALSVKNGTVTVARDYVLSPDPDMNKFTVSATARDTGEQSAGLTFAVTAEQLEPTLIKIGDVEGAAKPAGHLSSDLDEKELKVYSGSQELSLDDLDIAVTPKTGLSISKETGKVSVSKTGTYTVTVTAGDGSKKKLAQKFKVDSDKIATYVPASWKITPDGLKSIGSSDPKLSHSDIYVLALRPVGKGGSICDNSKASVKIKEGAVKVNIAGCVDKLVIDGKPVNPAWVTAMRPTADKIVLALSSKDELIPDNFEKTINLESTGTMRPAQKNFSLYTTDGNPREFAFELGEGVEIVDPEKCTIRFSPVDGAYGKEANLKKIGGFLDLLEEGESETEVDPDEGVAAIFYEPTALYGINKGSYDFYATLYETVDEKQVARTRPVKVTFKVTVAPKRKIALKPQIKMSKEAAAQGKLSFKTFKNVGYMEASISNTLVDGLPTNLADYFVTDIYSDDGETFMLVRNSTPIPEGVTSLSGMIEVISMGPDMNEADMQYQYFPVTVTFQ